MCDACVFVLQLADPSLLRFLVDMRGADPDDKQLRDDLMTMLIAGQPGGSSTLTRAHARRGATCTVL